MRRWARLLATAALALAAAAAWAQEMTIPPSPIALCLQPPPEQRGTPEYPSWQLHRQEDGTVRVRLNFTAADRPPKVQILGATYGVDGEFAESVKTFANRLRAPCLPAGRQASLTQDYIFRIEGAGKGVYWTDPEDRSRVEKTTQLGRCMVDSYGPWKPPEYPESAQRSGTQGRVYLQLHFEAPDRAPVAKVFGASRRAAGVFIDSVERWTRDLRAPCLGDEPLDIEYTFMYILEGEEHYGFKTAPDLRQLLAWVPDIARRSLSVDTTTMGCPFDLKLQYLRPHLPNRLASVGPHDPARRALYDWLAEVSLGENRPKAQASIYGDKVTVHVPCLKIDLKPQGEKT